MVLISPCTFKLATCRRLVRESGTWKAPVGFYPLTFQAERVLSLPAPIPLKLTNMYKPYVLISSCDQSIRFKWSLLNPKTGIVHWLKWLFVCYTVVYAVISHLNFHNKIPLKVWWPAVSQTLEIQTTSGMFYIQFNVQPDVYTRQWIHLHLDLNFMNIYQEMQPLKPLEQFLILIKWSTIYAKMTTYTPRRHINQLVLKMAVRVLTLTVMFI